MTPLSDALTAAQRRALAAYEYSEHDALDDQLREERYDAESPREGTEA